MVRRLAILEHVSLEVFPWGSLVFVERTTCQLARRTSDCCQANAANAHALTTGYRPSCYVKGKRQHSLTNYLTGCGCYGQMGFKCNPNSGTLAIK